ncbi:hypothetical protein GCM10007881_55260 [Mesorhizobium huakuii]|uniref:hypothetical protein n=1 Tax=Mesorhizobium huakuii TaxID=28104 RepID=UPI00235DB027|nr:hypothetical protein [Mesorhizobium huakuii]GLQ82005.1 hypothetical protein GCM10007881_55260 [Mesorhizobium huakuii]
MSRVPTAAQIEKIGITDQGRVLDVFEAEIVSEIWGIESGIVVSERKRRDLDNARRRLKRLEQLASDFGYRND